MTLLKKIMIYFLIKSNLDNSERYYEILKEFIDIYYELDMDNKFQNLALLFWAKDDLIYDEYQHYWDGADRTNIDKIIKEQFEIYIKQIENEK